MPDRSVTVRLKIDNSDFITGLAQATTAAQAFKRSLGDTTAGFDKDIDSSRKSLSAFGDEVNDTSRDTIFLGKGVGNSSSAIHKFGTESQAASKSVSTLGKSTEKAAAAFRKADNDNHSFLAGLSSGNDRMTFLVQSSLALGPALIPTLAAAVPAVVALGNGLAFAATAAGVGVLAFQGVGDALKAVNDAQLQPTEAHLETMRIKLEQLGPAGQDFVMFLQGLRPEMQQLQNISQEGFFPGLTEGINAVLTQAPELERVITSISEVLGDLSASAGESFTSDFWTEFFDFLANDAQPIMTNFARATGELIQTLSALAQAFGPLSIDISGDLADMATAMSDWAQSLEGSQGFDEFVAALREAGPVVGDTLLAIANAISALGEAGFDVGLASLKVLTGLLNGLAAVLRSPIGGPLLAIAAAMSAINRAIALASIASSGKLLGFLTGLGTEGKHAAAGATTLSGALNGISWGRAAAGAAALGLAFTDIDDNLGVGSSLQFGLAAFALGLGPVGVTIAATAGLMKDMSASTGDLMDDLDALTSAAETGIVPSLQSITQAQEDFKAAQDKDFGQVTLGGLTLQDIAPGIFGESVGDEAKRKLDAIIKARDDFFSELRNAPKVSDTGGENIFGLQDLVTGDILPTIEGFLGGIVRDAASVPGKISAVTSAFADLADPIIDAADAADSLQLALDGLLDPGIDLQRANDAVAESLDHFNDAVAKNSTALDGQTDAARKNREAFAGHVELIKADLVAMARHNEGADKVSRSMREQVGALLDTAKALGFNRDKVRELLKSYNLTPRFIKTVFQAVDAEKAKKQAEDLVKRYNDLPIEVRTDIAANGVEADATVKSLRAKYEGLSKMEAETILKAIDKASGPIEEVELKMEDLDGTVANVTVHAATGAATAAIRALEGILHGIDGDTATVNVNTNRTTSTDIIGNRPKRRADGGLITGPGGPRSDMVPIMASNKEFIVNAAATKANLAWLHHINARKFANGGLVGMANGGQPGRQFSPADLSQRAINSDLPAVIGELTDALREMRAEAKDVTEAEKDVKAAREASRQAAHALNQVEDTTSKKYRERAKASREADKDLEKAEKELSKQRDQLQKATDAWKEKQAELLAQAKAVQDAVLASGAIFGGEGTSITVGGMLAKLKEAAKDGREFNHNIAEIRAAGLDERLVQQLLDNAGTPEAQAAAENLANASRRQVKALNAAEGQLLNVAGRSGRFGVGGPGNDIVNVKFTGDITTTDVTKLPKALEARMRRAVRIARQR